ncbi:MAG: hypothetical protein IK075_00615 [Prevotella sp.]|nr:hypothetical protein [Prevotella sp.]
MQNYKEFCKFCIFPWNIVNLVIIFMIFSGMRHPTGVKSALNLGEGFATRAKVQTETQAHLFELEIFSLKNDGKLFGIGILPNDFDG